MIYEIAKIIFRSIFSSVSKEVVSYFKDVFGTNHKSQTQDCKTTLELHFGEVVNWSNRIEFIGLEAYKSISDETIRLSISNKIRKFNNQKGAYISEEDILQNNENYLLIGDPGAGKTTTLKRLTYTFLFGNVNSNQSFPVLIRLKEIAYSNLLMEIADTLGLKYEKINLELDENKPAKHKFFVGSQLIENAIPSFLNSIKALLILDGYDEINEKLKEQIKREITLLSRKSSNTKILLTSRHGEDFNQFEHFTFCEIKELDKDQIKQIVALWCENPGHFLKTINKKVYKEIFNRPLFLNFLILHFNKLGFLPSSTHDTVKQIIHLLLDEWNQYQGVKRLSRYSNFFSTRKFNLLSEVAFYVSFERSMKQFKHDDLIDVFNKILYKYELDAKEAEDIAKEIESHTGIIIELYNKTYEFSHLVLQEYLAAEYIVRQPFSNNIFNFFTQYPAVLAVSTCLSTDNGKYLSNLFLNSLFSIEKYESRNNVLVYLNRLRAENVNFSISTELGVAFLYLYHNYSYAKDILEYLNFYTKQENVVISIKKALLFYENSKKIHQNDILCLNKKATFSVEQNITVPEQAGIPIRLYKLK